jgi:hypothetical protein
MAAALVDRAAASRLVAALEHAWAAIRSHHLTSPRSSAWVASGRNPRSRRLNLGALPPAAGNSPAAMPRRTGPRSWSAAKASSEARSTCSAPCCTRPPTASPIPPRSATPAAKAAHNRRYATRARELGLDAAHVQPIGWSATSVPDPTAARYAEVLAELAAALVLWRRAEQTSPASPGRSRNARACSCACGRRIRVARSVLELAPILCARCAQPFQPEDDEER